MSFYHVNNCSCPSGCCDCGPETEKDAVNADIFYDSLNDEMFQLVSGASSTGPVGWCANNPNLIYLGKLGDSYYESIGRVIEHERNLIEFLERRKQ
jgi:hypothetical protein